LTRPRSSRGASIESKSGGGFVPIALITGRHVAAAGEVDVVRRHRRHLGLEHQLDAEAERVPRRVLDELRIALAAPLSFGRAAGSFPARTVAGRETKPFKYPGLGQGVSIGGRTGVGEVKGVPIRGLFCWLVWRSMLFYFFPTWDRRLRLLADWTIWPIVGRDIVWMWRDQSGDYEVRHNIYQAGEVIVDRARPVRYVHVLIEGEVDLRRRVDGADETLQTIGAGNHFGRKKLEQQSADLAVARSVVRTIALRDDQANRLQDVLASAGQIVAKTGIFPTAGSRSE
jgi:hypothetical protein